MIEKPYRKLFIALLAFTLELPSIGFAEWYADLYTGAVFTNRTDLTISSSLGTTTTYHDLYVNNTWTAGGRGGYWLDKMDWLGFGLDLFLFHLKAPNQSAQVTGSGAASSALADWSLPALGIGFDVLRVRAPLFRTEEFVHGRLQPFLSIGPALFVTWAGQNRNVQPSGQQGTDVALGFKADAGFTALLTQWIGLFAEYRFTHFTSNFDYQNNSPSPATETYKATYDSQQIIGGLTFRFH